MERLHDTEARKLDKFIADHLQPNEEFLEQVRFAINRICTFLKENCFKDEQSLYRTPTRVLKIVKGGSSGKGTALKGRSDVDLVVFLNIFKSYTDQEKDRKRIIQEIERRLKECIQQMDFKVFIEPSKWDNPRVLSFHFRSHNWTECVECDVLPAYDALGQYSGGRPDPQVYVDLINSGSRGGFSTCFTELQRNFIRDKPTKVKSLIRLVKHWYKLLPKQKSWPQKYALELLAVYAWEQGSGEDSFSMAQGFRTVLWLIQNYEELCIFWTTYYNYKENETIKLHLQSQFQKERPVILDPADPTGNIGEGSRWDLLAQEADYCSDQMCCQNFDGSFVEPWNVPVRKYMTWSHVNEVCASSWNTEAFSRPSLQHWKVGEDLALHQGPSKEDSSSCIIL